MTTTYLPVTCQIVGNLDNFEHSYSLLGCEFSNRWDASSWGIDELGHDDFNIATLVDGELAAIGWGIDDFEPADSDLPDVARQLGVQLAEREDAR